MILKKRIIAKILANGGVVSLPTDTIQGLSCLPFFDSLVRLVKLKKRSTNKGLILISNNISHFEEYVEDIALLEKIQSTEQPTTYLVKANKNTPNLLLGGHNTVALRLTSNPLIGDLCNMVDSALVTTSANLSGHRVATNTLQLQVYFKDQLDYIIAPVNTSIKPSAIINLHTGERLR